MKKDTKLFFDTVVLKCSVSLSLWKPLHKVFKWCAFNLRLHLPSNSNNVNSKFLFLLLCYSSMCFYKVHFHSTYFFPSFSNKLINCIFCRVVSWERNKSRDRVTDSPVALSGLKTEQHNGKCVTNSPWGLYKISQRKIKETTLVTVLTITI